MISEALSIIEYYVFIFELIGKLINFDKSGTC